MGKGRKIMSMKSSGRLTAMPRQMVKRPLVVIHKASKHSKQKQK